MATTATRSNTAVKEAMTKSQLLETLSESTGLQRKDVAAVLDELGAVIERHVRKRAVGNVHASRPAEDQGGAQACDKGAQDDVAVHRPGDHGGREARLAGGEGSAPERAQAHDGVGPDGLEGSTVASFGHRTRWLPIARHSRVRDPAPTVAGNPGGLELRRPRCEIDYGAESAHQRHKAPGDARLGAEAAAVDTRVESRTGAPTLGSGGSSVAFATGLSPAPIATFPVPAHQTGRADFPHPAFGRDHAFAHGRPFVVLPR